MDKYPEHDQEYFFKFTEVSTAKLILESQEFRYSSPLTFNDPFDLQTDLYFDFDISDFPERVVNELHSVVTGKRQVDLSGDGDWVKPTRFLKEKHEEGRYQKRHLDSLVKPLIFELTKMFEESRAQYNEHWKGLQKRIKIFCISETNTSILMWSHYAKYHTGVCFKLKVLPEVDNTICAAQKVTYLPGPPTFFDLEDWIDSIVIQKDLDFTDLYFRYPLSKSDIWEYEREWRVWAPYEESGSLFCDVPIVEGEIDSIYFGANSERQAINDLIALARKSGIDKFFKASKSTTQYGVEFQKI